MSGRSPKHAPFVASKGLYANYFEVGHTAFEFVIDFGETFTNSQPCCHTRIVTTPIYARALVNTLSKAVEEYRQRFGEPVSLPSEEDADGTPEAS